MIVLHKAPAKKTILTKPLPKKRRNVFNCRRERDRTRYGGTVNNLDEDEEEGKQEEEEDEEEQTTE